MRTRVLNFMHTEHYEAQEEHDRLALEEQRLTKAKAALGEDYESSPRRRVSEPPEDFDARIAEVRAAMEEQKKIIASGWVRFVAKGLPRKEFRRLVTAHPPLDTDDDPEYSKAAGFGDSFIDALIMACTVKTLAHELNGGGEVPNEWLEKWGPEATEGMASDLFRKFLALNQDKGPSYPR